jgi:ATP-binding protein involved in chromosome partitioning
MLNFNGKKKINGIIENYLTRKNLTSYKYVLNNKSDNFNIIIEGISPNQYKTTNIIDELKTELTNNFPKKKFNILFNEHKKIKKPKIILICSAKGGVGKSTLCYNLALANQLKNKKTAIIDADIYGPSIHHLCGIKQQEPQIIANKMIPLKKNGLQINSMGFLIAKESALIWRSPMIIKALNNLIENSKWDDVEYIFIDMPPGTGDVYISLLKNFPSCQAIIISQPHELSLIDTVRTIDLMRKLKIKILGLIENMNLLEDTKISEKFCKKYKINLLGKIKFDPEIAKLSDQSKDFLNLKNENCNTIDKIIKIFTAKN